MIHEQKHCRHCSKPTPWISNTKGFRDYCNQLCMITYERIVRKDAAISKIESFGFTYHSGYEHSHSKVSVTNKKCGHTFTVGQINNLFLVDSYCPECGNKIKYDKLVARNISNAKDCKYKESFADYRRLVTRITARTYRENKAIINPKNLPIGRIGHSDDPHHLDHTVAVKYCYEFGIEPDRCGSVENLRVIPAMENMQKYSKLTEEARSILVGWSI